MKTRFERVNMIDISILLEIIIVVLMVLVGYFGGKSEKKSALFRKIAFWLGFSDNLIETLDVSFVDLQATMDDFGEFIEALKEAFEDGRLTQEEVNKLYAKYIEAKESYNKLKNDYESLRNIFKELVAKIKQ
jgi:hypothetical protein